MNYIKSKNHMKVQSTSSFTVKPGQTFLGGIKFEPAMLSSFLVLISHSPVEESVIQKKSLIQELNSDWINKASIFKVAKRCQYMWGVLIIISFEGFANLENIIYLYCNLNNQLSPRLKWTTSKIWVKSWNQKWTQHWNNQVHIFFLSRDAWPGNSL